MTNTFSIKTGVVLPTQAVTQAKQFVEQQAKVMGLTVEFKETPVETTQLEITVTASTAKVLKNLFKAMRAPEDEINKLIKLKSCVEQVLFTIAQNILNQMSQLIQRNS